MILQAKAPPETPEKRPFLRTVVDLLTPQQRALIPAIAGLILISGCLEVLSLSSLIPVIMLLVDPQAALANTWVLRLYSLGGFSSFQAFTTACLAGMLGLFILKAAFTVLSQYIQTRYAQNISKSLSERLFKFYLSAGLLFHTDQNSVETARRISSYPRTFISGVFLHALSIVTETVAILFVVGGMLFYQPQLFVILCALLVPVNYLSYKLSRKKLQELGAQADEHLGSAQRLAREAIQLFKDIRLSHKEPYFIDRYMANFSRYCRVETVSKLVQLLPIPTIELSALFGVVILFAFYQTTGRPNSELLVTLGVFAVAAYRLLPSSGRILGAAMALKSNTYVLEVLDPALLNRDTSNLLAQESPPSLSFQRSIELKNIAFHYADRSKPALRDVSLVIPKGACVGVVGPSGSGKSTLLNVLLRFLHEDQGSILVDGETLVSENERAWQLGIGLVDQSIRIIDGTVIENVAFGCPPSMVDTHRLNEALRYSQLEDFVRSLPQGLETRLGEDGVKFSGGQRQRIGIARALYNQTNILVFDEATSSLDHETEAAIVDSIGFLTRLKKTIIIVAHRLSTLKHCTQIYELQDGVVSATYDSLTSALSKHASQPTA